MAALQRLALRLIIAPIRGAIELLELTAVARAVQRSAVTAMLTQLPFWLILGFGAARFDIMI
jgi:hypothetical protein